jgi:hypothetical protein
MGARAGFRASRRPRVSVVRHGEAAHDLVADGLDQNAVVPRCNVRSRDRQAGRMPARSSPSPDKASAAGDVGEQDCAFEILLAIR